MEPALSHRYVLISATTDGRRSRVQATVFDDGGEAGQQFDHLRDRPRPPQVRAELLAVDALGRTAVLRSFGGATPSARTGAGRDQPLGRPGVGGQVEVDVGGEQAGAGEPGPAPAGAPGPVEGVARWVDRRVVELVAP